MPRRYPSAFATPWYAHPAPRVGGAEDGAEAGSNDPRDAESGGRPVLELTLELTLESTLESTLAARVSTRNHCALAPFNVVRALNCHVGTQPDVWSSWAACACLRELWLGGGWGGSRRWEPVQELLIHCRVRRFVTWWRNVSVREGA
jgi:hypothetical protein